MKPLLNREAFQFTTNKAFSQVMQYCKNVPRAGQDGTWINDEVIAAYTKLHKMGYAHSAEVWQNGELAGGLYGIKLGNVFFGESMFSLVSNASRYAFIKYVQELKRNGLALIDCQIHSDYLESLGARMIGGKEFQEILRKGM